jgi:REP element-mobilizing transposase RayT
MALYKNKYRIESTRLKEWDYSSNGHYFITVCTKKHQCFFGDVINGKMQLNEMGKIAEEEWKKTEQIRKNVKLDEYRVMPNHLHGIIVIENELVSNVETHCSASLPQNTFLQQGYKNKFGPQRNNLSSILRGFKSATTNRIHTIGYYEFSWQERFHDHIIRNEKSLQRIREYIRTNPLRWHLDTENPNRSGEDEFDKWL